MLLVWGASRSSAPLVEVEFVEDRAAYLANGLGLIEGSGIQFPSSVGNNFV